MAHRSNKGHKPLRVADVLYIPELEFEAQGGGHPCVRLIMPLGDGSTLGLRFDSVEHLMYAFDQLVQKAVKVWPDHPLIQEYLSEE